MLNFYLKVYKYEIIKYKNLPKFRNKSPLIL